MSKMYETIRTLARDMTDTELCKQCGLSRSTLSELKKGRTEELSVKTLNKLAGFFNVPISVFSGDPNIALKEFQQEEKATSISVSDSVEELRERLLAIQKVLETKPENEWRNCLDAFEKLAR